MVVLPAVNDKPKGELNLWTASLGDLDWTYIERPTQREMDVLSKKYTFLHPLNLEDCLSRIQRPKVDEYDEHLFMVLHFPVFDKEARISLPSELDIFIGKNFIVTVHCRGELKSLAKLFKECQLDNNLCKKYMEKGSGYLFYQVIDRLVDSIFPMLDKINDNIEGLQDTVISKPVPQTAQGIFLLRRDIISMRRIIRPQIEVIDNLERDLENQKYPFLEGDTSNWLTSHRIQEIMRVLTIFTSILMVIEVVASMEGSNVLPAEWHNNRGLFFILLGVQLAAVLGLLAYFRHRRWT
ncbi:MAG: magnesium transporter [Dehalococcoidia bacterium]|nr:magnesium transporter [Dehalococcoidia bacterium]